MVGGALALAVVGAAGCATSSGQVFAWAVANQPTATAPYTPPAELQWSSTGSPSTVTRTATGRYTVAFPNAAGIHGGNVQVTAVGTDASYCKPGGWTPAWGGLSVSVLCWNGGVAADSAFAVSYGADYPPSPEAAYAWYDAPTAATQVTVTPPSYYASNVASIYVPTDRVILALPSVSSLPMEHVTAVGSGPEHCSFNTTGIACFDLAGTLVEQDFSYVIGLGRVRASGLRGAYATFDVPWPDVTTVTPRTQGGDWGTATGSLTVTRTSMGQYEVVVPGAATALSSASLVHVTAYDIQRPRGIPAYCKVTRWFAPVASSVAVIDVGCYWLKTGAVGTPADHGFRVSLLAAPPPGPR